MIAPIVRLVRRIEVKFSDIMIVLGEALCRNMSRLDRAVESIGCCEVLDFLL